MSKTNIESISPFDLLSSEKCHKCNVGPLWNNKKIELLIDFVTDDEKDDNSEKPVMVCPNCFSQSHPEEFACYRDFDFTEFEFDSEEEDEDDEDFDEEFDEDEDEDEDDNDNEDNSENNLYGSNEQNESANPEIIEGLELENIDTEETIGEENGIDLFPSDQESTNGEEVNVEIDIDGEQKTDDEQETTDIQDTNNTEHKLQQDTTPEAEHNTDEVVSSFENIEHEKRDSKE